MLELTEARRRRSVTASETALPSVLFSHWLCSVVRMLILKENMSLKVPWFEIIVDVMDLFPLHL